MPQISDPAGPPPLLRLGDRLVPLTFVRHPRARRYILTVTEEPAIRITLPRGGSRRFARAFAERHVAWLTRQVELNAARFHGWRSGSLVYFRGRLTPIEVHAAGSSLELRIGDTRIPLGPAETGTSDLRPHVEAHLRSVAQDELPRRTRTLADRHAVSVSRISIRNQRSRWGSCSARGTISLNWRLVQTPDWVAEYVIVHELMHRRQFNHSPRFWQLVAEACPRHAEAREWLRSHGSSLRDAHAARDTDDRPPAPPAPAATRGHAPRPALPIRPQH